MRALSSSHSSVDRPATSTGARILMLSGLLACLSSNSISAADRDHPFLIAERGQPQCVIVVSDQPTPAEQTAALELQRILKQVTDAELPIQTCQQVPRDAKQIVVGPSQRFSELLPDIQLDEIGEDGIVMRSVDNALLLAGPQPRGTL